MKCLDRIVRSVLIAVWIAGAMSITAGGATTRSGGKSAASPGQEPPPIIPGERIKSLLVMVEAKFTDGEEFGAGIIFGLGSGRVYIATANHLARKGAQEARSLRVQFKRLPGELIDAKLLKDVDRDLDLAVLAVDLARLDRLTFGPFDQLGDPSALKRGDSVWSIGNPRGRNWYTNVKPDSVSGKSSSSISFESAFIEKGHSGGALLNERMEIVGMIRSDNPPEGVASNIRSVLDTLKLWEYPVSLKPKEPEVIGGDIFLRPSIYNFNAVKVSDREMQVTVDYKCECTKMVFNTFRLKAGALMSDGNLVPRTHFSDRQLVEDSGRVTLDIYLLPLKLLPRVVTSRITNTSTSVKVCFAIQTFTRNGTKEEEPICKTFPFEMTWIELR